MSLWKSNFLSFLSLINSYFSFTLFFHYFFSDWLKDSGKPVAFEALPEDVLCSLLRTFYAELRTKEGKIYSRSSLMGIRAAIQRHLTGPGFNRVINIISGPEFRSANDVLTGQLKDMKVKGLDVAQHHDPISDNDIRKMYSTKTLCDDNQNALQLKVYFEIGLHFGRRGREGLRELRKDHIIFKTDDVGNQYATLNHNPLEKNYQASTSMRQQHDQRMYGTNGPNCPLRSLKKYLNRLHPQCPWFFQRPRPGNLQNSSIWYCNSPVGVNTISKFMSTISKEANSVKSTQITVYVQQQ